MKRRIAVTGVGLVTPLGIGLESNWHSLMNAMSGLDTIKSFDITDQPVQIAGEIKNFSIEDWMLAKEARRYDHFLHYGVATSDMALKQSEIDLSKTDLDRFGVCIGSGIGGIATIEKNTETFLKYGAKKVSPFYVAGSIINMVSGVVSIRHGLRGPNISPVSACTTGAHAIALSCRLIQTRDADIVLAGGSEHSCTPTAMAGFHATRALSTRNDEPTKASRPWDEERDGFVLSNGAASLVLEEWELAKKRGAKILAEVVGVAFSGDAHHITLPPPDSNGAIRCIKAALNDAQLNPEQIDYINAHGTSTPAGDLVEINAIKHVFKDHAKKLAVSSTKSMTGHALGAAGAIEGVFSVQTLMNQEIPPTINLDNPSEGCDLDLVPHHGRQAKVEYVLSNSFGFGGANCSIIFAKA